MKRILSATLFSVLILVIQLNCGSSPSSLILATTTSTADSGLLDDILPTFEAEEGVIVKVLAVGTGQALALGERGDADVILVHDTNREVAFIAQGFDETRHDVMFNDFVILGPSSDPAKISGSRSAVEAFAKISDLSATDVGRFVSRGDESGTNSKELEIWELASINAKGDWYQETGQGMGNTLTIASELQAYTISDRGTYLSRKHALDLQMLVEGDPMLFNQYGIIAVSPERNSRVNQDLANRLVEHILREETQQAIADFGIDNFGEPLFQPNAKE